MGVVRVGITAWYWSLSSCVTLSSTLKRSSLASRVVVVAQLARLAPPTRLLCSNSLRLLSDSLCCSDTT